MAIASTAVAYARVLCTSTAGMWWLSLVCEVVDCAAYAARGGVACNYRLPLVANPLAASACARPLLHAVAT
ncbi:hypothetical protein B296_00030920 [Ensete ventricosum]|uniref:Secreted protein n=1 Tax=Ensete ventricosum TaxID=4639 RepID=A0A426YR16_ENSVE|nr:hypothetical protein B296_00030920 [Ensete ventricosum]